MAYNAADQYDKYYSSTAKHPDSIYTDLYGEYPIFRLKDTLMDITAQAAAHIQALGGDTVRMVDFGCGNGRYFPVFEEIAALLQERGMKLELQAYDISSVGLEHFKQHLEGNGYRISCCGQDFTPHTADSQGYRAYTLEQGNVTVHFVHGNAAQPAQEMGALLGQVDITAMLFGVLGHIPGRENRRETLRVLGEISDYSFITTVANRRHVLQSELRFYDALRNVSQGLDSLDAQETPAPAAHIRQYNIQGLAKTLHGISQAAFGKIWAPDSLVARLGSHDGREELRALVHERLGIACAPGDVYYDRIEDGKPVVTNYYHMWTQAELQEDVEAAGLHLNDGKIRAEKLAPEGFLTRHLHRNQLDELVSRTISGEGPIARILSLPIRVVNSWSERLLGDRDPVSATIRQGLVSELSHYFLVVANGREQALSQQSSKSINCC